MTTTCQICARPIKAKTGLIALHGYQRPGNGWQTSSCMGARHKPYEVSCDAILPAIASCTAYIANQKSGLCDLMREPPAVLKYQRRDAYLRPVGEERVMERPIGFLPTDYRPSYNPQDYVHHFDGLKRGFERRIESSKQTLRYLQQRLADWKAPA